MTWPQIPHNAGEDRVPHADPGLVPQAGRSGSARRASRSSRELLADNALYRLRSAQGVIGLADRTTRPGWRPPARRRSRPGTRPTGLSRASWPPAPKPTRCPLPPGMPARRRSCAARPRSPTSSRCPARSPATPCAAPGTRGHVMTAVQRGRPAPAPSRRRILLAAHVRSDPRCRGPASSRPASPACPSGPSQDEIAIQVPETSGDLPVPRRWRSPGWPPSPGASPRPTPVPARPAAGSAPAGSIAGHPVHIFTPVTEEAAS